MAAPDPAAVERKMYVDMHLNGVDDLSYTLAELRDMGGGGVNAHKAAKASNGGGSSSPPVDTSTFHPVTINLTGTSQTIPITQDTILVGTLTSNATITPTFTGAPFPCTVAAFVFTAGYTLTWGGKLITGIGESCVIAVWDGSVAHYPTSTAGSGSTVPDTPAVAMTAWTSTSITISYSTTTTGIVGWQYRLDGGPPAALDGTSPDTITGLSPSSTGTVQVRCTKDGSTYSAWGTSTYSTSAPPAIITTLSWTDANPAAASGDSSAWTYTVGAGAFGSLNSVEAIPPGQDGQFDIKMGTPLGGGGFYLYPSYCFGTPASNTTDTGLAWYSNKYRIGPIATTAGTVTSITPLANDILRLKKVGLTVEYWLSIDSGTNFVQLGASTLTRNDQPYFLSAWLPANQVVTWVKATSTKRWGVKTATNAALDMAITGSGITKTGDATAGYSYAMSATGTGYANASGQGFTRAAVEFSITGMGSGVEGGSWGAKRNTAGGGTVNNTGNADFYTRVLADHSLFQKVPNVAEGAVANSVISNTSRAVILIDWLSTADWQYVREAVCIDGTHQWKALHAQSVGGGQATPNTYYFGAAAAVGTMTISNPRIVGTYT